MVNVNVNVNVKLDRPEFLRLQLSTRPPLTKVLQAAQRVVVLHNWSSREGAGPRRTRTEKYVRSITSTYIVAYILVQCMASRAMPRLEAT